MFKKAFQSFSIYTFTSVCCAGITILTLPTLTKVLSEEDYGTSSIFSTYILILMPLLGLSSGGLFWVEFFKKDREEIKKEILFSTYFWFTLFCTCSLIILLLLSFPFFEKTLNFSFFFLLMLPIVSFMSLISEESKNYFININAPWQYFTYSVISTLIEMGLSFGLVILVFNNWKGRIIAWIISLFLQTVVTIFIFSNKTKYLKLIFSISELKKLIRYGMPLIFHQLGKFVVNQSDRLFIAKMISIEAAGLYSVAYQVGSMILLPISAFNNFYIPFLFEALSSSTKKLIEVVKISYLFIIILFFMLVFMYFFAPIFYKLMIDEKFHKGIEIVNWVALSYLFWGLYLLFSGIIFYKKKTLFLGIMAFINIISNMVFNYFFIQIYGAVGAAYATSLSFFIILVLAAIYSNFLLPLPWFYNWDKNPKAKM